MLGMDWKTSKYVLLGDDLLIGDHRLAEQYKELIQGFGVDFSPSKTYESDKFYEFAKCIGFRGVELTPFPIHALKECSKFYDLLPLLFSEIKRG
jgi:hypothetical protein